MILLSDSLYNSLRKKTFLIFQVIFLLTLYFDSLTLSHCGKLEFLGIFWLELLGIFSTELFWCTKAWLQNIEIKFEIENYWVFQSWNVILELKWYFTTVWWYSSIIKLGSVRRLEKWTPLNISRFFIPSWRWHSGKNCKFSRLWH